MTPNRLLAIGSILVLSASLVVPAEARKHGSRPHHNYHHHHRHKGRHIATGVAIGVGIGAIVNQSNKRGSYCQALIRLCNRGDLAACAEYDVNCW